MKSLSPLRAFLSDQGLITAFDAGWDKDSNPWSCYPESLKGDVNRHTAGLGATEEAAVLDWCMKQLALVQAENETLRQERDEAKEEAKELQATITSCEEEVAKVYCELTNNRFSKMNTRAEHVLSAVEEIHGELAKQFDLLQERSVGAMAIAEGDEGWEKVPVDCPMLGAVSELRKRSDKMESALRIAIEGLVNYPNDMALGSGTLADVRAALVGAKLP